MKQDRASKKQLELFKFVKEFISSNGFGPSYREVMAGLGYKSVSTVAIHVDALIAKGYLARRDKSARSLEIVGASSQSTELPSMASSFNIEHELIKRCREMKLDADQADTIRRAFTILRFEAAASDLAKGQSDETANE